jgi:hypothetical protein
VAVSSATTTIAIRGLGRAVAARSVHQHFRRVLFRPE